MNKQIEQLLTRGVEEIIDGKNLKEKLLSGEKLRVKLGIDPTSKNIHLGRTIPLLKLRDFQRLGHKIVFIIGDFTGLIGDTSDKDGERPMLSEESINENLQSYIKQASKIINIEEAEIYYNSKWLSKLSYMEIGRQADIFSLNEFISRDNINRRLTIGKRVSLRELLYPLMQGYDSVQIKADVELGGTDQRFNLLTGRDLQKLYKQEPQDIMTNPIIEGLDGRKMSSSYGNTVNLFDSPNDMFGKIMSMKDDFIIKYFTLLTRVDIDIIKGYERDIKLGKNPRSYKVLLAGEMVRMYHSEEDSHLAEDYFIKTISNKEVPKKILEFTSSKRDLVTIMTESGLSTSNSDARRVIQQGGVKVNSKVVSDPGFVLSPGDVLQKGKINFIKIL
ncbi:MAG: tyrosine--tRNA ligase [Patescibacteria group bacterium]